MNVQIASLPTLVVAELALNAALSRVFVQMVRLQMSASLECCTTSRFHADERSVFAFSVVFHVIEQSFLGLESLLTYRAEEVVRVRLVVHEIFSNGIEDFPAQQTSRFKAVESHVVNFV